MAVPSNVTQAHDANRPDRSYHLHALVSADGGIDRELVERLRRLFASPS